MTPGRRCLRAGGWILVSLAFASAYTAVTRMGALRDSLPSCEMLAFFGIYWFIVAASEETMFRGFLQGELGKALNPSAGLLVAAAAFLAWHGAGNPREIAARVVAAVAFGLIYLGSRSLWPAVLTHWLVNMGQLM